MRNRVSHGYHQVDLEIVWKIVHSDLPGLYMQIQEVLASVCKDIEGMDP